MEIDVAEHGARGQRSERRLFMQLLAFGDCHDSDAVVAAVRSQPIQAAVYADLHDAHGIGLLTMSEDPAFFVQTLRPMLQARPFADLTLKPQYTMVGRTYAIGYEPDLDETLLHRPRRHALTPDWPWTIWYPLRRSGQFERLSEDEQKDILKEHGTIGFAFGRGDHAHDIRLACHGLDTNDSDFVIGVMGKALAPLSVLIQTMRKTQQTSLYLERLGPFFVGHAIYQSPLPG